MLLFYTETSHTKTTFCVTDNRLVIFLFSGLLFYLIHLQEGPCRASFWQRHPSIFIAIGDREDLADEAGEVSLLSKLGLMER